MQTRSTASFFFCTVYSALYFLPWSYWPCYLINLSIFISRTVILPLPGCWQWKPWSRTCHHRKRKYTRTSGCFWVLCQPSLFQWRCYRTVLKWRMSRRKDWELMPREHLESSAQIPLRTTVRSSLFAAVIWVFMQRLSSRRYVTG